jgi:molybdopterin-guanine dinucleotide biosynthesis protein A
MTLTAVLLVGGRSRRMGADKATLEIAGEPLWNRQLQRLRELQPEALFVSARIRPAWCPAEIDAVLDEPPSRGPLSGLAATLRRARTSHVVALAIDLPRMTVDHLRRLWTMAQPGCGCVPLNESFFEPLCAIYPVEAAEIAARSLASTDVSLQHFVQLLQRENLVRAYPLETKEKSFYRNANTPEDLLDGGD